MGKTAKRHSPARTARRKLARAPARAAARPKPKGKTFVLVAGAWHGGWSWARVARRLRARGHEVFTPTLTGIGERSHLMNAGIDLDTHITDIVNLLTWEGLTDVVLVGHSNAGFVVSGVAEKCLPAIAAIVFVDAFVPESGQSLADLTSPQTRELIEDAMSKGELGVAPRSAASFGVNEKDRAWVDAKCTPQPIKTFLQPAALSGARARIAKKAYVRGAGYANPGFDSALARAKSDPTWRTFELPCGHDVMVDMPDRLAAILQEVA